MIYFGIDPGKSGAIAAIVGSRACTYKMPDTEGDILEFFSRVPKDSKILIERLHGMPGMSGTAMFSFGRHYGSLRMGMLSLGLRFDDVPPQTWQKALGCLTKGDKNITKARAQELFPGVKCTHINSDALLIAEYLRRRETSSQFATSETPLPEAPQQDKAGK